MLVVLSSVCAQPGSPHSTIVSSTTTGFDIEFPLIFYLPMNTDHKFNIHVFNHTNGVPILNDTAVCYFHLYSPTGEHLFEGVQASNSHDFDYGFSVAGGNFSVEGEYQYIVQCNSSTQGGWGAQHFYVNEDGEEEKQKDYTVSIAIVIFLLFILLILFIMPFKLDRVSKNEILNNVMKRLPFVFGLLFLSLSTAMVATISINAGLELTQEIFTILFIINWSVYLLLAFIVLSTLFSSFKMAQQNAKLIRMEGKK